MTASRYAQKVWFIVAIVVLGMITIPVAGTAPWGFIVTGDSRGSDNGVNATILNEIADEIIAQDAAFVLFTGDLVNSPSGMA